MIVQASGAKCNNHLLHPRISQHHVAVVQVGQLCPWSWCSWTQHASLVEKVKIGLCISSFIHYMLIIFNIIRISTGVFKVTPFFVQSHPTLIKCHFHLFNTVIFQIDDMHMKGNWIVHCSQQWQLGDCCGNLRTPRFFKLMHNRIFGQFVYTVYEIKGN